MKKILVISDNETLVRHFKKVINEQSIERIADFDYCFSFSNKSTEPLVALGMKPVNLKQEGVCENIAGTYQIVLSVHCKQIFPAYLVRNTTCINFHPGFNPYNRGWYPQVFSIINKKPIGVTIHIMDELVDHGPIIVQNEVFIEEYETSLDVYNKVIELEKDLIEKHLNNLVVGDFQSQIITEEGNYNSIQNFNELCILDMNNVGTLQEHIDLLRALTHGSFKNAFYLDGEKKIYVRIEMTVDER